MDLSRFLLSARGKSRLDAETGSTSDRGPQPLSAASVKKPFEKFLGPIPKDLRRIPSMIGPDEKSFLYHLAREYFTGAGIILDGGIFLGASTYYFAKGLEDNAACKEIIEHTPRPVVSLDRAVATASMITTIQRSGIGMEMVANDSFEPLIRDHISTVQSYIDLRIGDILKLGSVDSPIEILFLDVLKTPQISEFAMYNYFTRLIPGRSVLIHQDYFIDGLFFIRAHQEALAHKFEYIGELGASGVFLCIDKISEEDVRQALSDFASLEKILHYLDIACSRSADPCRQILMMISQVRLLAQRRQIPAANEGMAMIEKLVTELGEESLPTRVRRSLAGVRHICANGGSREALAKWFEIAYRPVQRSFGPATS